jgi:hypothetical protein
MNIILKASEEILGYADTSQARTDPPMGCGEVVFFPNASYSMVEELFRERSLSVGLTGKRDEVKMKTLQTSLKSFNLSLATDEGEPLSLAGFTVIDCRSEHAEDDIFLEFYGLSHEQFKQLFPGHYESFEKPPINELLEEPEELEEREELEESEEDSA